MAQSDEMLTSSEFAALQRVGARRIRALAVGGRIAGARKWGRDWLIPAQAKIAVGTRGPASNASAHPAGVTSFKSIAEFDRFQSAREVAMAVRVQAMNPRERFKWLGATWGTLQRQPLAQPPKRKASARHFESNAEKNRHDEALEIAAAVARARAYPASRADRLKLQRLKLALAEAGKPDKSASSTSRRKSKPVRKKDKK
jgi:hypothetical protein